LIFTFDVLNVHYISTSGLLDLLTSKVCHVSPLTMKISTKFEVDTTIRCLSFLLLIHYVTLWPWPLTFWPWSVIVRGWLH